MLVYTALMMALIMVCTMAIRIPIPMTQGYVHLGDALVFLGVLLLGKKYGAAAAGIGAAMADVLGGFAFWAPFTLVFKAAMAYIAGAMIERQTKTGKKMSLKSALPGMVTGGLVMTAGYFIVERFIYGSWAVAAIGIPWNIGQFAVGIMIALASYASVGHYFTEMKENN